MLSVVNLSKRYDGDSGALSKKSDTPPFAIRGVDLEVEEGDFFTLLGPSGCGKSTTLRSIAGLETPTSGAISVAGLAMFEGHEGRLPRVNVPVNRRALGMVFQSYAIWPHMNVFDNVAFPLQVKARAMRPSKAEITQRVDRMLETMELSRFADRPATMLSGGQQQRLAEVRAASSATRSRHHHRLCDARSGRGAGSVEQDRGDERRQGRADRHSP